MKLFAVMLASIAAIAASVQAYLIWSSDFGKSTRLESDRISACRTLIRNLSVLERLTRNPEELIENALSVGDQNRRNFRSDYIKEVEITEEMRRASAENMIISFAWSSATALQTVTDVDALLFSDNEKISIGFSEIGSGVQNVDRYQGYSPASALNFQGKMEGLQKATARLPAVKEVCEPILLEK